MQIKIISVPVVGGEKVNEELNAFLRGRKILQVEQQLVNSPEGAYWSFCVRYIEQNSSLSPNRKRERKDYKQILSEKDFTRFSQLRAIRKQIAQEDSVPAFAVFTDEELAGLARLEDLSSNAMRSVKGIGEKKVEKYSERILNALKNEKSQ